MAGIPYCHDRADDPPDKEEYEKAMGEYDHEYAKSLVVGLKEGLTAYAPKIIAQVEKLTAERDKAVKELFEARIEFQKLREDVVKQYDACLCPDRNCTWFKYNVSLALDKEHVKAKE